MKRFAEQKNTKTTDVNIYTIFAKFRKPISLNLTSTDARAITKDGLRTKLDEQSILSHFINTNPADKRDLVIAVLQKHNPSLFDNIQKDYVETKAITQKEFASLWYSLAAANSRVEPQKLLGAAYNTGNNNNSLFSANHSNTQNALEKATSSGNRELISYLLEKFPAKIESLSNEVLTSSTKNNVFGNDSSDDEYVLEEISDSDLYGDSDDEPSSRSFK